MPFRGPDAARASMVWGGGSVCAASISVLQDLTGEKGKNPSIHPLSISASPALGVRSLPASVPAEGGGVELRTSQ